jgi:hypothetical protein
MPPSRELVARPSTSCAPLRPRHDLRGTVQERRHASKRARETTHSLHKWNLLRNSGKTRVAIMKTPSTEKTRYTIKESYRKQPFGGVINQDRATRSWSWKGHIDFEDGPYSEFTSRRSFTTGLEAEDHMRRFAYQRIDSWFSATQPGSL